MNIKKGDFIEMEFTAKIKNNNQVFDTTSEETAKKENIYSKEVTYKPIIFTVGQGHVLKGLDEFIVDKEPGTYNIVLSPENAFGKKDAKLLRLIGKGEFTKHDIDPMPGLEVDLDGNRGIIRTVNGGRVIVDFNHPLASQEIEYDISIKRIVSDEKEKIEGLLNIFKIPFKTVELQDNKATISFAVEIPQEITKPIADEIVKLTGIKDIMFK
jgi:FKBP-type peptidyl-prolyl cis-trans isomerase 2